MSLLLHPLGAAQNVAGGDEQGGNDQLFHRIGVGTGGVEDHDAVLGAAVDGNVVSAGTRPGDGPQGVGEDIVVHGGRAHQDTVLIFHVVAHLETALVQLVQAGGGDLVQSFDTIHNNNLESGVNSNLYVYVVRPRATPAVSGKSVILVESLDKVTQLFYSAPQNAGVLREPQELKSSGEVNSPCGKHVPKEHGLCAPKGAARWSGLEGVGKQVKIRN